MRGSSARGDRKAGEAGRRAGIAPLALLRPYLLRHRWYVAGAAVALLAAAAATLAIPLALRRMIDVGFAAGDPAFVDRYFAMLSIVVAVLAAASATRYYLVTWLGERIVADLRADVFAHLLRLSPTFFDTARSGELVSRLSSDATQIKSTVGSTVSSAARNLLLFVGAVAMMVVTSPGLSGLVLVAIPVIVLPLYAFGRQVRRRSRRAQDVLADATAGAAETIGAIRTVQAFAVEPAAAARYRAGNDEAFGAARSAAAARAALTGIAIFLVFASVVVVLWMGAQDVFAGRITAGALGQFVLYAVFAAGALGELSTAWGEIALAAGAAERMGELLAETSAIADPAEPAAPPAATGAIAFEGLTFHYPGGTGGPVIEAIDLAVAPGETVALVGPSGAGKSTLFALALRFYDPVAGRVCVDGIDARRFRLAELRRRFAMVPQDTFIFAASIRDNIAIARPEAAAREVDAAAAAARVDDFAARLPAGLDTVVGERGVTLSGGQRQRIAIARALLADAPILLLDEATSALDAESEQAVQAALEVLRRGRTTLVIAHRLATVLAADRIVVLDGGRIVEVGDHRSLSAAGGLYARLARLQFEAAGPAPEAAATPG